MLPPTTCTTYELIDILELNLFSVTLFEEIV